MIIVKWLDQFHKLLAIAHPAHTLFNLLGGLSSEPAAGHFQHGKWSLSRFIPSSDLLLVSFWSLFLANALSPGTSSTFHRIDFRSSTFIV
jgi:hypothetical protein